MLTATAKTMMKFEELPANARALILAKLAIELQAQKAANIYRLAQMREIDIASVWRSVCRKARQPVCTIPLDAINKPFA